MYNDIFQKQISYTFHCIIVHATYLSAKNTKEVTDICMYEDVFTFSWSNVLYVAQDLRFDFLIFSGFFCLYKAFALRIDSLSFSGFDCLYFMLDFFWESLDLFVFYFLWL